ncbi:vitamin K epoxide reductase family protein [Pedobacter rhodius]|uniref:Thioredoxin domain-containing protein n=1 Tax=Pedobacter rhodius TaxID=3004098 RepID=A0ABT4L0E3_9SPHI|nr:thioredoxin domain-containing protein [Pedobacter sp. SJ11]MCZ4224446.1 thioredoxin domain-containing protein [Pedobacter sp. SJ11]
MTTSAADTCLKEHPGYPSILALSDCLREWNVDNYTYRIDKADFETGDLLFPFAAHFTEKGGRFVLVQGIEKGNVYYTDEGERNGIMTEEEFLKRWDGIAFHAEGRTTSGEKSYRLNYLKGILQKMLLPLGAIFCITILGLAIAAHPFSLSYLLLCTVKLIGAGISILLLTQSINSQNPFIRNLCGLAGKSDCNNILKSDAAQITSWLSWSEIGFFYFTGSLLLLLVQPTSVNLIAWLNLAALPYTLYSISYQYRHKNWCVLCCAVQFILWSEFVVNISFNAFKQSSGAYAFYFVPILFFTPVIGWFLLKPLLYLSVQVQPLKQDLKNFKFDTDLFMQRLFSQPRYAVNDDLIPISLGNPNAPITITMVSNPYCNPCAKAHEFLKRWMVDRDDIQGKVVFTTNGSAHDFRTKVARHLIALTLAEDNITAGNALTQWYEKRDTYEAWALQYPATLGEQDHIAIEKQRQWCSMADIAFTPTIFINGYKIPTGYQLEDLKYLL